MTFTRTSDRWKLPATVAGFFVLLLWAAVELFLPINRRPSDSVSHVLLVLGAGLVSPTFVVDLVRAWRGPKVEPPVLPRSTPGPTP